MPFRCIRILVLRHHLHLLTVQRRSAPTLLLVLLVLLATLLIVPCFYSSYNSFSQADIRISFFSYNAEPSVVFKNHRLQFCYEGKCIGVSREGILSVEFCNPRVNQTFSLFEDGKLMFEESGLCVDRMTQNSSYLSLDSCENAARFNPINGSFLQLMTENVSTCILSMTSGKMQITLAERHDELSCISFLEETAFLEDRKALLVAPDPEDKSCNGSAACGTNKRPPPVEMLPPQAIGRCTNLFDCVTVVTKTARRPLLVVRMAQSVRDVKGYDLPIIAYDDGPANYTEDVYMELAKFPNLEYIASDKEDIGISVGRNLAISNVKSKYFLLVDDDNVFNEHTDLEKMVEILDTTDATLVGGRFTGYRDYSGMLQVVSFNDKTKIVLYKGSCSVANQTIPNFPDCLRCDLTSNVFLARTREILEVGGWSKELKVGEHKDLFLRLKASGKKVVYCPDFQVFNKKPSRKSEMNVEGYSNLRHGRRLETMKHLFSTHWNVFSTVEKGASQFNYKLLAKPDITISLEKQL